MAVVTQKKKCTFSKGCADQTSDKKCGWPLEGKNHHCSYAQEA